MNCIPAHGISTSSRTLPIEAITLRPSATMPMKSQKRWFPWGSMLLRRRRPAATARLVSTSGL